MILLKMKCITLRKIVELILIIKEFEFQKKIIWMNVYFPQILKGLKFIFPKLNMRSSGCAALDLAYVGSGRLDGYFHNNINLWDIAAGILIVKEAGGITNDISKFNDNNINIRAASSGIFEKMMEKLGNF